MITADELRKLKGGASAGRCSVLRQHLRRGKGGVRHVLHIGQRRGIVADHMKEDKEIIFVPDKYLGTFVAGKTGRNFILWEGYCPTHARIMPEDIQNKKRNILTPKFWSIRNARRR